MIINDGMIYIFYEFMQKYIQFKRMGPVKTKAVNVR